MNDLLKNAWTARNELYNQLFGNYTHVSPENYGPPSDTTRSTETASANVDTGDPGAEDQKLAVLTYGPDPTRPYWTYLTAGLSSPWLQEDPQEVSGFGCELIIKSPIDAPWPSQILRSLAYYIFNHVGTISPGTHIGLNSPIVAHSDSKLRNIITWYADEAPDCWYQLPSGGFGIFAVIGITDDELSLAESIKEYGTFCIQQILRQTGYAQITDPNRLSVMGHKDINNMIDSVTSFAKQFR